MKILNVRRGAGQPIVAWLDIEIEPGVRIFDIALKRNGRGELRVFAPSPNSKHIVSFDIAFAEQLIEMATATMGSRSANGINQSAA